MLKLSQYEQIKRKAGGNWPDIKYNYWDDLEQLRNRCNSLYNRLPEFSFTFPNAKYLLKRRNRIGQIFHRIFRCMDNY